MALSITHGGERRGLVLSAWLVPVIILVTRVDETFTFLAGSRDCFIVWGRS